MFDLIYPRLIRRRMNPLRRAKAWTRWFANSRNVRKGHLDFLADLAQVKHDQAKAFLFDLFREDAFFEELEAKYLEGFGMRLHPSFFEYSESHSSVFFQAVTMYLLIRSARPTEVVETGGASGATAAFSLLALEHNGGGRLITLDLPPDHLTLPDDPAERALVEVTWWKPGMSPCFLVPDSLRNRHELRLGDSRRTLPELVAETRAMDLFRHDSDHRYEPMTFEFETAFAALKTGGYVVSDDYSNHNAWPDFCRRHRLHPVISTRHFAGTRKP